ncbi:MAG: cation-transporting P-type ATPase [Anaerolineales bacterium]
MVRRGPGLNQASSEPALTAVAKISSAYWAEPVDRLLTEVESRAGGLTSSEADERRVRLGPNALRVAPSSTPLALFLGQFRSPLVLILVAAAIVSIIVGEWADTQPSCCWWS